MKLSARQLATVWFEALHDAEPAQWSSISKRMLNYIYTRGELRRLREVMRYMSELEHQHNKTIGVTVRTATTLPTTVINQALKQILPNTTPVITTVQDQAVIGGIQIETTNQRFDLSLRGRLRQLTNALTN